MVIRDLTDEDWPGVWRFLREIVAAGETFPYDPRMSETEARAMWVVAPPGRTVVAVADDGAVAGTANMYANRPGGGSHIASGSLMVDPRRSGRGVGRALTEEMITWARAQGFRGIQFNAVVEGRPYERISVDIFDGDTLTEEFGQMNPMRTTPVLELAPGSYLPESNAILAYLAHGSRYVPEDPHAFAQVLRWLIYEQTDVVPMIGGLRFRLLTGRLDAEDSDARRRRRGAIEVLQLLDEHLHDREFFVAEVYSIADIALFGYTHLAHEPGLDLTPYANVKAWIQRVTQQPGFIEDVEPYGPNARPGAGRSLYG